MSTTPTDYIILRKTPYQDTSLILAGLSREFGRVDLLVKGAKKISSKKLSGVDLFREISISINTKREGLHAIYSVDIISNFDNIAMDKNAYMDACEISRFILRNSQPENPCPDTYNAVRNAFLLMSEGTNKYCSPLVKLIYLEEHGLMPELPENRKKDSELLSHLIKAAKGIDKMPEISREYMNSIYSWIESLCKFNDL